MLTTFIINRKVTRRILSLLFFVFAFFGTINAQVVNVTVKANKVSIESVLNDLKSRYGLSFVTATDGLNLAAQVTVTLNDKEIVEALKTIFAPQLIEVEVSRNIVKISAARPTGYTLSGVVGDTGGEPVPGATIIEKGTNNGVNTDNNGVFSIELKGPATIQCTCLGYNDQEARVSSSSGKVQFTLAASTEYLDEVVVVGYGVQRKVDVTGSIEAVNAKDMLKRNAPSAGAALQGLASGVNVVQAGLPGGGASIRVRGVTSFGNNSPLVIVDGIEQSLNNISSQDIESIQVLKDARVAAIYGVRGSNGVILVSTKKGKSDKPRVSYSGYAGMAFPLPGNVFNIMNSEEYMNLINYGQPGNDLFRSGMPDYLFVSPSASGPAFEGDPLIDPSNYFIENPNKGKNYLIQKVNKHGTDWFHEAFKKAFFYEHNVSVIGGSENAKYYFSGGYLDQQGTLTKTYHKRYSIRVNTEYKINDWLKVGENLNFYYRKHLPFKTGQSYGGITALYKLPPIIPVRDIMGNWGGTAIGTTLGSEQNPVAVLTRNADKSGAESYNTLGNLFGEIQFMKGLVFRSSFGFNTWHNRTDEFIDAQAENAETNTQPNQFTITADDGVTLTYTNTLNYSTKFGKHSIDALLGTETIQSKTRMLRGGAKDFDYSEDYLLLLQLAKDRSITPTSSKGMKRMVSLFGRLDYIFDDRYMFGVTVRRDGSSVFGPRARWGNFPSFSAGWRISQEKFMKNVRWISDLKLRASYGILGSANNVSSLNQFSTYAVDLYGSSYNIQGDGQSSVAGIIRDRIGNYFTSWERDKVLNFGLDASLFNYAWDFQLDFYKKSIDGLLLTEPLPSVIGALVSAPKINVGDIQNTGFDFSTKYKFKAGAFSNEISVNFGTYKNKIISLPDPGYFGGNSRNEVGHPTGMFYGYKIMGIFKDQDEVDVAAEQDGAEPGRFRYVDTNNDDKITPEDRQFIGSPHPDFTYGFVLSTEFKGFDFSAHFYGVQGNKIYNNTRINLDFFQSDVVANHSRTIFNAWRPDNTGASIPKIETARSFSTVDAFNDYALEDGSYLKLKTISIGYTMNPKWMMMKKLAISNLRLYCNLDNVFTLTRYSGLDPEIPLGLPESFGYDTATYPTSERRLTLGLNITF